MGFSIKRTEGGHKRGHSNVDHWTGTERIKAETKKVRRQLDKRVVERALRELTASLSCFPDYPPSYNFNAGIWVR